MTWIAYARAVAPAAFACRQPASADVASRNDTTRRSPTDPRFTTSPPLCKSPPETEVVQSRCPHLRDEATRPGCGERRRVLLRQAQGPRFQSRVRASRGSCVVEG